MNQLLHISLGTAHGFLFCIKLEMGTVLIFITALISQVLKTRQLKIYDKISFKF